MHNLNGMVADRRKALEQEWMRARQPMYVPVAVVVRVDAPEPEFVFSKSTEVYFFGPEGYSPDRDNYGGGGNGDAH